MWVIKSMYMLPNALPFSYSWLAMDTLVWRSRWQHAPRVMPDIVHLATSLPRGHTVKAYWQVCVLMNKRWINFGRNIIFWAGCWEHHIIWRCRMFHLGSADCMFVLVLASTELMITYRSPATPCSAYWPLICTCHRNRHGCTGPRIS